MKVNLLFMPTGNIEEIKISSTLWSKLHHKQKDSNYWFNKENFLFLDKFDLKPTVFNLNCLNELKGIILTDRQVDIIREKGGVKK